MKNDNPTHSIHGILLVNKPKGLTSNAVLQRIKHHLHAKKAGHTGSLDPMATGMLPLCFGEATKFSQYLLNADKCYEVTGVLGVKTNTGDAMGEIIATHPHVDISLHTLQDVLLQFVGPIQQVPSMFSALKHQGQPLYKYARAGIEIERKARDIFIHQLDLNHFDGQQLSLTVTCSKGTYIRNLVEDIGERLGVGAHINQLHRCYTAGFETEPMFTMDELLEKSPEDVMSALLPMERAISTLPSLTLDSQQVLALQQGKTLPSVDISQGTGSIRLYTKDSQFMGLGDLQEDGLLKAQRLLSLEP
jgi:tRNA pseudouridine55 synthase